RAETFPNSFAMGASTRGLAATHAAAMTTRDAAKNQNPVQLSAEAFGSVEPCAAYMWLRVRSAPVANARNTWIAMNTTKYSITGKCSARAHSTGYALLSLSAFFGQMPLIRTPVTAARGAAMKIVVP